MKTYLIDEQLPQYGILNLSECGRFWKEDYKRPANTERSKTFDTFLEANRFIKELKEVNRDPSFSTAVYGYEIVLDHYISVIYSHRFTN